MKTEIDKTKLKVVASALDDVFNGIGVKDQDRKYGFVVLVYKIETPVKTVEYISNIATKLEILALLKKQVQELEEEIS